MRKWPGISKTSAACCEAAVTNIHGQIEIKSEQRKTNIKKRHPEDQVQEQDTKKIQITERLC